MPTRPLPPGVPTFLGASQCTDLNTLDADIAVLGVPYGFPHDLTRASICSKATHSVRAQSIRFAARYRDHYDFDFDGEVLAGKDVRIVDCGDIVPRPDDLLQNHASITEACRIILRRGAIPLILGGDHSVPIPVLQAFDNLGEIYIVQIDAHLDWRDEVNGIRLGLSSPMRRAAEMTWVSGMAQIGLRGIGSATRTEVEAAKAYGSLLVSAQDLHRNGVASVLDRLPAGRRYYLTIDADGLDPSIAPGVDAPGPGGLTYYEATELIRGLAGKGEIVGCDFVEIVPHLDPSGITSYVAARMLLTLIGVLAHSGQICATQTG